MTWGEAISPTLRRVAYDRLAFRCPGCRLVHQIGVGSGPGPRWTWEGGAERPTFRPSILTTWPDWIPARQAYVDRRCHSFVTDGRIEFLADSTHPLAGQTVDLPPWESSPCSDRQP